MRTRSAAGKKVSYSKVCDTLVQLGYIQSWTRERVDESFNDTGLWCTYIKIVRRSEPLGVSAIHNEVYGKHAELYVYADSKSLPLIAAALRGAGITLGDSGSSRIVIPVTYFKGSHWWE